LNPGSCYQVSILDEFYLWVPVYLSSQTSKNYSKSGENKVKCILKNSKIQTSTIRFHFDGTILSKGKYEIYDICLMTRSDSKEQINQKEESTEIQLSLKINPIFLKDPMFTDFTLKLKDYSVSIPAHKIVLATHSVFFEEKLKDPTYREQELTGIDFKTFKLIYEYMYTNKMKVDEELIPKILSFTVKYKFNGLYDALVSKHIGNFQNGENFEEFFTNEPFEKEYFVFLDPYVEKNLNEIVLNAKKFPNQFLEFLNVFFESHKLDGMLEREKAKKLMKRLMDIKLNDLNSSKVEELIEKLDTFVNK
jgi:hypothetical protein